MTALSIMHLLELMAAAHPVVPVSAPFCVDYSGCYPEVGSPGDISSGCSPYRQCCQIRNIGEAPLHFLRGFPLSDVLRCGLYGHLVDSSGRDSPLSQGQTLPSAHINVLELAKAKKKRYFPFPHLVRGRYVLIGTDSMS